MRIRHRIVAVPNAILDHEDEGLSADEFYVLGFLQDLVGTETSWSFLATRTGISKPRVGKLLLSLHGKGYIVIRRPQKANRIDGKRYGTTTRLMSVEKHALQGVKKWIEIPPVIASAYPDHFRAHHIRVHMYQMWIDYQTKSDKTPNPRSLPHLPYKEVAKAVGVTEDIVESTYATQREYGWLRRKTKKTTTRIDLPTLDGKRKQRRIVNAPPARLARIYKLFARLDDAERILDAVNHVAPSGTLLDGKHLLEWLSGMEYDTPGGHHSPPPATESLAPQYEPESTEIELDADGIPY